MMDAILAAVLAVLIYAVLDTAFPDEPIQNPEHHVQEIEQADDGNIFIYNPPELGRE